MTGEGEGRGDERESEIGGGWCVWFGPEMREVGTGEGLVLWLPNHANGMQLFVLGGLRESVSEFVLLGDYLR